MSVALIALGILWLGLIAYAVLGGADFGAGIWNLFAVGPQAKRQSDTLYCLVYPVNDCAHRYRASWFSLYLSHIRD